MERRKSNALDLCSRIKKTGCTSGIINQKQCFVLRLLADCVGGYIQRWNTSFHQETESNQNRMAELLKELLPVLESGSQLINLCNQKKPSSSDLVFTILGFNGQVREIIDDVRIYVQMINRLIMRILKLSPVAEKQLSIEKLMLRVESDCNSLKSTLQMAYEEDKEMLIHSNQFQSGNHWWWPQSGTPVSNILKMLKTAKPNINDANLTTGKEKGAGSFGSVQSAMWHKLPVAVKTFTIVDNFKYELRFFKMMLLHNSSHIVHMLGHTQGNKLVLELMDMDLERHIRSSKYPLPLIHSIDVMLQIAKAMKYLHSIDLIHRDLKPSNVLVNDRKDRSPCIKLADFGISKDDFSTLKANHTRTQGTIMYMAPEMLEGRENYSRKIDVYSYGLICAEILTGRIRNGKTLEEMCRLTKEGERPLLPSKDIPKTLERLIRSCMEYDDEARPSFKEICHNLWLVKEEILISTVKEGTLIAEVNTAAIELKVTTDGLEGLKIEKVATASTIDLASSSNNSTQD